MNQPIISRRDLIQHCQRQGHTPKKDDVDAALATADPIAAILPLVLKRKAKAADPAAAGEQWGETAAEAPETPEIDPMNQQKTLPPEAKDDPQNSPSPPLPSSPAPELDTEAAMVLLGELTAICSGPAPSFTIRRVQAELSGPESAPAKQLFARLSRGLRRGDYRLANGRKVESTHAAAVWLLQQLAAVLPLIDE